MAHNATWNQGEDLYFVVTYREDGAPVDLTGWSARMDLVKAGTPTGSPSVSLFSFNTDDDDPETDDEITMDAEGRIVIDVSRSLTLGDGPLADDLVNAASAKYKYDLFVRDTGGRQRKILDGEITVNRSVTRWM